MRLVPLACAVALAAVVVTPITQGGIVPVGDPIPGHSWGQRFVYDTGGAGPVNVLAVRIVAGGPFESPTLRDFDVPGWRLLRESGGTTPNFAVGAGPTNPVDRLSFEIWFESEPEDPVSFVFAAWRPGEVRSLEAFRLSWAGKLQTSWDCVWVVDEEDPFDNPLIPAPAAVVLGGLGLGVVGWFKRRLT